MKKLYLFVAGIFLISFLAVKQAQATKHIVEVKDFVFDPAELLNVNVGDTIRWVWVSGFHTTTSSSIPAGAQAWDALITPTITFYEYVVEVPGTYDYVCTPHVPQMVATFVVLPAQSLAIEPDNQNVTAEAGSTSFSVFSNTSWNVESNASWCTTTSFGDGNGTIEVDYEENAAYEVRTATITVTAGNLPAQMVTVTQAASTVSVAEIDTPDFRIYPNPSSGHITLNLEKISGKKLALKIVNLEGKNVFEESYALTGTLNLDLSHLSRGTYLMILNTENRQYSQRLLLVDR
jgi:plastocyanin